MGRLEPKDGKGDSVASRQTGELGSKQGLESKKTRTITDSGE